MSGSFFRSVTINSNEGFIFKNALNVAPPSTSKVVTGSGSFNTGFFTFNNNGINTSSAIDPDAEDSNIIDPIERDVGEI
ncbi:spore germination protein [Gracilibacillus thailandensis]|uniref:Spore germination protein n=1 Tax=Gracilibacillus thailandensis TaxID=563735 RepID=A0A6N7R442_9BACI|nr:spore germination protein [Gracilibacillus thailandensis]MRI67993.1 spore germination protein [Gracilibacillus thailandensis]